MNTYQLKTTKGKPVINSNKLPIYELPIDLRLKITRKALQINNLQTFNK